MCGIESATDCLILKAKKLVRIDSNGSKVKDACFDENIGSVE
ncbi:6424_t:CDS:2 [Entrophospora sp. SA101]|nr:3440_t:CDS:2 [Entrophospora candida]CAJ0627532.1 6424_t:CDS:2 [Entrophospora sp. SA101]CAG8538995.1 15067_t:CDS:2 [Entrophospora candida]CAJ0874321.1 13621_t:CDS:2 [Entrophospora sp. SA101]CAJ0918674.1 19264_t:CDS:2 [Entrophospora sp. SA101]